MRLIAEFRTGLFLFVVLFLCSASGFSQTFQFKNYSNEEGLNGRFVYTVNQDSRGFIWLGTGSGISTFDGFEFYNIANPDSSSTAFPVSSLDVSDGSIVYGYNDGTAYKTSGDRLIKIEGIEAFRINDIIEGKGKDLYFFSQSKGVFKYNFEKADPAIKIPSSTDYLIFSGAIYKDSLLLLGTSRGLVVSSIRNNEIFPVAEPEELDFRKVQAITKFSTGDKFVLGTEDDGAYLLEFRNGEAEVSPLVDEEMFNRLRVKSLQFDSTGDLWLANHNDGVIKLEIDHNTGMVGDRSFFTTETGLTGNNAQTIYFDKEGNTWIGLYGDGVSILASDAYSLLVPGESTNNRIIDLFEMDGKLIAGSESGYYVYDLEEEKAIEYVDLSPYIRSSRITSFEIYKNGSLLFSTDEEGCFIIDKRQKVSSFYSTASRLENQVSDVRYDGSNVWFATMAGVITREEASGKISRYTMMEGVPHNSINQLLPDGKGKVYIATEGNRLYTIDPEGEVTAGKAQIRGSGTTEFKSFSRGRNGSIWGATLGKGIYRFAGDSVVNITTVDGLFHNYCYSIFVDSRNNVWVGHSAGFSVYDTGLDQIMTFENIFGTGAGFSKSTVFESSSGMVLMGSDEGFMKYNPELDQSRFIPPSTNIISITIDNKDYPLQASYTLPYRIRYNVTVNYAGLYYSNPEKVYYKHKLDNYDLEWSDPTYSRSVNYKLSDGEYHFELISYNYDGITDSSFVGFDLIIKKPFWRLWWFIGSLALFGVVVIIIVVRVRERSQRKAKEYLEKELDARTKEVIFQKEEIETQNREITDSINYAQRIQAGLLPASTKLEETFDGSFTFYRPRDIVSGDFYWFDRVGEDKFIIACADSTGHGVPGAFMSMIGSALLQEIVLRKEITRPSQILKTLDKEISSTLNQDNADSITSDGMDIIVCEFDLKTRLLRFASAMRPVILVMDGEQYYIRGNKSSVGGEAGVEKYFDDQEYFLKKGDSVYLFSDGYPDQFGGPQGKKLKIIRTKNLIDEIKILPMDQQYQVVSEFFDEWKGDQEQVDDVLFMGISV